MHSAPSIKAEKHMSKQEIIAHLEGVEYIIMAAPNTQEMPQAPIHFTIFLNTSDAIPKDIQKQIIDKFATQYAITNIRDLFSQLDDVAFAITNQETPMPMHLYTPDEKKSLPSVKLHVIDFLADAKEFSEVKQGQTGWSYSYN